MSTGVVKLLEDSARINQHLQGLDICERCTGPCSFTTKQVELSDFLVINIALHEGKNVQTPSPVISADMSVSGTRYKLAGAVLVRGHDHFYSVVRAGHDFVKLDSLRDRAPIYPTFASAVMSSAGGQLAGCQQMMTDDLVYLNDTHDGVHVLVYARESYFPQVTPISS